MLTSYRNLLSVELITYFSPQLDIQSPSHGNVNEIGLQHRLIQELILYEFEL